MVTYEVKYASLLHLTLTLLTVSCNDNGKPSIRPISLRHDSLAPTVGQHSV